jgi:hypothetical protein
MFLKKFSENNYREATADEVRKRKCVRSEWRQCDEDDDTWNLDTEKTAAGTCVCCGSDETLCYILRGTTTYLCSDECFEKLTRK